MRHACFITVACLVLAVIAAAAPRQHVVTFGKWMPVQLFLGPDEDKAMDLKVRSLYVDGRLREFTTGDPHDITERMFVVRRAYRLNDWLPSDQGTAHKWKWKRGVTDNSPFSNVKLITHIARELNFFKHFRHKELSAKPRIDRHQQYHIALI